MSLIILILFTYLCIRAFFQLHLAITVILLQFQIEQLLQSYFPYLRDTLLGNWVTNIAIGVIGLLAAVKILFKSNSPLPGYLNKEFITSIMLFVWSAITILWTPSQEKAIASVSEGVPYFVVNFLIGLFLLTDIRVAQKFIKSILVVGLIISVLILINPEFTSQYGRLGLQFSGIYRTNSLSLGELGGLLIITGLLLRNESNKLILWNTIRLGALIVGAVLTIQSGARGQLIFAVLFAGIFFLFSAPVFDIRRLILSLGGLLILGIIISFLMNYLLYGFEAKRFSFEEIMFGASSSEGRMNNVLVLVNAWSLSPMSWIFGLGFLAFNSLHTGQLDPYSHVLIADTIFELGLPGFILCFFIIYFSLVNYLYLFKFYSSNLQFRSVITTFIALDFYYLFLANKQGQLWGCGSLFFLLVASAKLRSCIELESDLNDIA